MKTYSKNAIKKLINAQFPNGIKLQTHQHDGLFWYKLVGNCEEKYVTKIIDEINQLLVRKIEFNYTNNDLMVFVTDEESELITNNGILFRILYKTDI